MLIASVSDIHTDYAANRDAVVVLASEIHRRGADVAIIAGDISHKDARIERVLRAFREVAPVVLFVPGNHDIWFSDKNTRNKPHLNTWTRYREHLKDLTEACGVHYLPASTYVAGPVAFAGTCGWYDYSFVLPHIRAEIGDAALSSHQLGTMVWTDHKLTAFRGDDDRIMDDANVCRIMEQDLASQLRSLDADDSVEHVVAVTHHQAFDEVVRRSHTLPWEFFNAFMGSTGMGEVIRSSRKVKAHIYGHTHFGKDIQVDGFRVVGTPLGYPRERGNLDEAALIASRLAWIEL